MARVTLIEAAPWDAAGVAGTAYLAGGGARGYNHRGRTSWKGGVVREPKFTSAIGFDQSGWTGGALPQVGRLAFFPALASTLSEIAALQWIGAPIEILVGDDDLAAPVWTTLLKGNVASIKIVGGMVEFVVADAAGKKLADPFLKTRFLGTGGAEGDAEVEGRIKRRSFGKTFNVEGRVLRKAYNVFEFSDPTRPLQGFTSVRDKGRVGIAGAPIAWAGSIAATLAALEAATPPAGGYVAAPSIACVKWWTIPSGPLTADIQGEIGAGYINTATAIATRIAGEYAVTVAAPSASVNATKGATAEAGLHVAEESDTVANVLDRILLPCGLVWVLDAAGVMSIRDISLANPVEAITISGEIDRIEGYRPVRSRKLAYQRAYRKHDAGEISAAVLVDDVEGLGGLAQLDIVKLGSAGPMRREDGVTPLTESGAGGVLNGTVSVASTGELLGAGGGDVTIGGIAPNLDPFATNGDSFLPTLEAHPAGYAFPGALQTGAPGDPVSKFARMAANNDAVRTTVVYRPVPSGIKKLYLNYWIRKSAANQIANDLTFLDAGGAYISAPRINDFATTGGAWAKRSLVYDVPDRAAQVALSVINVGVNQTDVGGFHLGTSETEATVGATWGANLNNRPANLAALTGTEGVNNGLVSIASTGELLGAGGGDVTISGIAPYLDPQATNSDNLIRNALLANGLTDWTLQAGSTLVRMVGAATDPVPAFIRGTNAVQSASELAYPNGQTSSASPIAAMIPLEAGRKVFWSFLMRTGASRRVLLAFRGRDNAGGAGAAVNIADTTRNTGGAFELVSGSYTIPANMSSGGFYLNLVGASVGSYTDVTGLRVAYTELNSTVGATWGTDVANRPANLSALNGSEGVNNGLVSIASTGELLGAGGGDVTLSGIGFTGDTDAQRNSRITIVDGVLTGVGTAGRVVDNSAVNITGGDLYNGYTNQGRVANALVSLNGIQLTNGIANQGAVANSGISIASTGELLGAGGGDVTATGLGLEEAADVTKSVGYGPTSITVACDYQGTPKEGQLNRTFLYKLITAAGVELTSGVTGHYRVISGTVNGYTSASGWIAMTGSGSVSFPLNTLSGTSAVVQMRLAASSRNYYSAGIPIDKFNEPPPTSTGGGSGPTTIASNSPSATVGTTSYTTVTGTLTGQMPTGKTTATISVTIDLNAQIASPAGTWNLIGKVQRDVGGVWTDIGSTANSDPDPSTVLESGSYFEGQAGWLTMSVPDTGLTAGSAYSWRVQLAITSGTTPKTIYVGGNVTVTA